MSKLTDFLCPFCGSEPEDIPVNRGEPKIVACLEDGCPINGQEFGIEEWERRPKYLCPDCNGEGSPKFQRFQLSEKVCEVLAGFRKNGEWFDPDTNKYLDEWISRSDQ